MHTANGHENGHGAGPGSVPNGKQDRELPRPRVKLLNRDGNAFRILGACMRAARAAGWSDDDIGSFHAEATDGDYSHLLATVMKFFDVE